jgi:tetratricopeptide (TPR) repeat protein
VPSTNDLVTVGEMHRVRGDYAQAERLLRSAVSLAQDAETPDALGIAVALNGLGLVCKDLAKYDEARELYRRALTLLEQTPGIQDDSIATLYHNLGGIEHACGNYTEGEVLARQGLAIRRESCQDDELLARDMAALAAILDALLEHDEAEAMYVDALRIFERAPETNRGEIAVVLNGLGALHARRGSFEQAEALLTRAVSLKKETLGPRHADVAVTLNNLGLVYKRRGDLIRAATVYQDAVDILEQMLGAEHPKTIACRRNYTRCVDETRAAAT